jgi:hypothetical protein
MSRTIKRAVIVALALALLAVGPVRAQFVVFDPAVTLRNSITAALQEYLFNIQRDQRRQVRKMARRLSLFTNLDKYALTDTPEWRIHVFFDAPEEPVFFARDYHAALNYGDRTGTAYRDITQPLLPVDDEGVFGGMDEATWRAFSARLATVNIADAVAMSATNDAGLLRYNGRQEQAAIEALEAQVVDSSDDQSATAVLEKVSGAVLVGTRQRQARTQFMADIVEQLLVDTKRARDTETTALNMQLTTWRDGKAVNDAFAKGTGDALRTWRQP